MRISARNQLAAKVVKLTRGAVNAEVELELEGGARIVSVITNGAIERLGLTEGGPATAIIKSSNVMIGVD